MRQLAVRKVLLIYNPAPVTQTGVSGFFYFTPTTISLVFSDKKVTVIDKDKDFGTPLTFHKQK